MEAPPRFITVDDYESAARKHLPSDVFDYYAGGAGDERTLEENRRAFERWVLRPRVLRGAGSPDPRCAILGAELGFPVLIAPWAYARMAHPDGEVAMRRAAERAGSLLVVSSTAFDVIEDVAAAGASPAWWQLYLATDRGFSADMLARVTAARYAAIVWTVDFVGPGLRHRDTRSGFVMPFGLKGAEEYEFDPSLTWEDLGWIREHAPSIPILIKGILTREDAALALEHGADGVIVSNHGGRQLDAAIAALDALPEVVEAVDGRVPVLMDGGVRRGTDVVMALALGATAVLVARPICWGLAVAGEEGVVDVLRILRTEVENAMALCGARDLSEVGPGLIAPARP